MPRYRLYFIHPRPRHVRSVVEFEAEHDSAAERHAEDRHDGRSMELWRDDQMIRAFPPRR